MKYFAKVKYLGTNFCGFQVQPEKRTVQGELCTALSLAFGVPCKVTGCSRTDSGVHANEFCIAIENDGGTIPADKLPVAVAKYLPNDLSLFWAQECQDSFHPRYNVISKEYLYRVINEKIYDPFEYGRAWFVPRSVDEDNLSSMKKAAEYIVGKHDFSAFMSEGSDVEDRVRTVYYLNVDKKDNLIEIRISADGFLYNMVRIIVGTLFEVAAGRIKPEQIAEIIASKKRENAGPTAPPQGLYLNKVVY